MDTKTKLYTMAQVKDMFGISPQTIRNWIGLYGLGEFFSSNAKPEGNRHARFTWDDILIFNTIDHLTSPNDHDWGMVADKLRSGFREAKLPERAAIVAVESTPATTMYGEAVSAQDRLALVLDRMEKQDRLISELQDKLIVSEQNHTRDVERLMRELSAAKEGKMAAETELRLIKSGWRPPSEG